jgi:HK97 family phage prohead protease
MAEPLYKFIVGESAEIKSFNDNERSFTAWASKEGIDRDREVLKADGWDLRNFKKNPVVPLFHDYRNPPVAKSIWTKPSPSENPEGLLFKPQFADTASGNETYYLYREGYMNAFSVGFDPKEWIDAKPEDTKSPRRTYTKQELLEISCVVVPAHPGALVEALESGLIKTKQMKDWFDNLIEETKDITKPGWDETSASFRHRLRDPSLFIEGSFRTIPLPSTSPKVKAVVGKLTNGNGSMVMQTLIFEKSEGWTLEKAKKWFADHSDIGKEFEEMFDKAIIIEELNFELSPFIFEVKDDIEIMKSRIKALESIKHPNIDEADLYDIEIDENSDLELIEVEDDVSGDDGDTSDDLVEVSVGTGDDAEEFEIEL